MHANPHQLYALIQRANFVHASFVFFENFYFFLWCAFLIRWFWIHIHPWVNLSIYLSWSDRLSFRCYISPIDSYIVPTLYQLLFTPVGSVRSISNSTEMLEWNMRLLPQPQPPVTSTTTYIRHVYQYLPSFFFLIVHSNPSYVNRRKHQFLWKPSKEKNLHQNRERKTSIEWTQKKE